MSSALRLIRFVTFTAILVLFYIATTYLAHAQSQGFVPLQQLSDSKLSGIYKANDLTDYINKMFFFAISLGGIFAVGRLAYAGWLYMLGEGYGNLKKAKEIVGNVTIGVLILLSIWLILNLINPQLLNLDVLKSFSSGSPNATTNAATNNGSSILNF